MHRMPRNFLAHPKINYRFEELQHSSACLAVPRVGRGTNQFNTFLGLCEKLRTATINFVRCVHLSVCSHGLTRFPVDDFRNIWYLSVFPKFGTHMSVDCKYTSISKLQPIRCNVSWFIYLYRLSTCFRLFIRPSSGAHNCTYTSTYCQPILLLVAANSSIVWQYLKLYVQLCAPDDGRRNLLKHVESLYK